MMNKSPKPVFEMIWDGHRLEIGRRTLVMGILNVTPDSFSDGGKFFTSNSAIAQGEKLCEEGADILDIGGESTRPFSKEVSEEEEIRRVLPIIENLAKRVTIPISIDTTKAGVAKQALDAGASIINDIGALRIDPSLADLAAQRKVPIILMHMKGMPGTCRSIHTMMTS
jgi:dihydropteroate synthase